MSTVINFATYLWRQSVAGNKASLIEFSSADEWKRNIRPSTAGNDKASVRAKESRDKEGEIEKMKRHFFCALSALAAFGSHQMWMT